MNTDKWGDCDPLTRRIIGCAMTVSNALGSGFLEKVYENALVVELRTNGLATEQQKPLDIYYRDILVGEYFADIVVEDSIILELKAAKAIDEIHQAQLLNYLKMTGFHHGLLLNFGTPKLGIKRMAL
jgi:GxxExxY protein